MAWNKPKNHKSESDPWGNKNRDEKKCENEKNKKNTILDLKKILFGFKNIFNKNTNSSVSMSKKTINPLIIIVFIISFVWFFSGFYTISETERGVVTRFGKFSHLVNPGLNWRPIFINEVKSVNVETVRELAASGMMLTADENVVRVEMNVQYKITNPSDYLFSVSYPDDSLRQATDSALRGVIGRSTMDRVLTEGRTLVRSDTQKEIEETIKPYKMGITILDVNFQTARPPEEVKEAFDDAIAARENREQYVREAEGYSNAVQPEANGKSQRILEEARAYASHIILEAQGEVSRFSKILPEYRMAKQITLKRLYIESMERLFSKNKKIFIDKNSNPTFFLSLDHFFNNIKSIDKNFKNNINISSQYPYLIKKNNPINYFNSLPPNNILEQRRIDSIRNDVKNSERK